MPEGNRAEARWSCTSKCGDLHERASAPEAVRSIDDVWKLGQDPMPGRDGRRLLYRGQGSAQHRLHTTLDRQMDLAKRRECRSAGDLEQLAYRSFQRDSHHHLSVEQIPPRESALAWLALMRHYGAPTRLLDWSYSFWVALFFAAADATSRLNEEYPAPACVWVIDDDWVQASSGRRLSSTAKRLHQEDPHCDDERTFYGVYVKAAARFVRKQNAWHRNARLIAQQGCFLVPGDVSRCFQSNLASLDGAVSPKRQPVRRIDFPVCLAPDILDRLDAYGINHATLYPDLEGITKKLSLLALMPRHHASELTLHGIGGPKPKAKP